MHNCEKCYKEELISKVNLLAKTLYGNINSYSVEALETIVNENRGSGQTTGTALKYISESILNPGQSVKLIHDHADLPRSNRDMREIVKNLIETLEFKYLVISKTSNTLTYKI